MSRILRSNNSIQTPPAALSKKTQKSNRLGVIEETPLQSKFDPIEGFLSPGFKELKALAKLVEDEFGTSNFGTAVSTKINSTALFRRGNLYDEYSARRNERLKRKKWETGEERIDPDPAVLTRKTAKRIENLRRSVPVNFLLRSKENARSVAVNSKESKNNFPSRTEEKPAIDVIRKRVGAQMGRRS